MPVRRIVEALDIVENIGTRLLSRQINLASETVMRWYVGERFIDVPFDESNAQFRAVQKILKHLDGTMRFDDVGFDVVTLHVSVHSQRGIQSFAKLRVAESNLSPAQVGEFPTGIY